MLRLYLNGELLTEGHSDALRQSDPTLAMAGAAGRYDWHAGAIVFFGSPAAAVPLQAGTLEVTGRIGQLLSNCKN